MSSRSVPFIGCVISVTPSGRHGRAGASGRSGQTCRRSFEAEAPDAKAVHGIPRTRAVTKLLRSGRTGASAGRHAHDGAGHEVREEDIAKIREWVELQNYLTNLYNEARGHHFL
jgi:hypothetical protein